MSTSMGMSADAGAARQLLENLTPLTRYRLDDLLRLELPETEWLVEGLFPTGALVLLVGRPKAGKSLLCVDLLAAVAAGEPFLGRATRQGPALYVPAEDALGLVRTRLQSRVGEVRDLPLVVVPADGSIRQSVRLDDAVAFSRLALTIRQERPRVVVLDPFREFHHHPENDADQMAALLRPLRQLAHASKALVVLVHHRNKHASDPALASRGSSAITGAVDAVATLETVSDEAAGAQRDGEQALRLRLAIEGRFGPPVKLGIRLGDGLRWEASASLGAGRDDDGRSLKRRIVDHLREDRSWLTAQEIAEALVVPINSVLNNVTNLTKQERVARAGSGTKADPYRYQVASREAVPDDDPPDQLRYLDPPAPWETSSQDDA